jgi:hypothetical protein
MIDPPEGWKYKFPKYLLKEDYDKLVEEKKLIQWIFDNGYPKNVADQYGNHFHIRIAEIDEKTTRTPEFLTMQQEEKENIEYEQNMNKVDITLDALFNNLSNYEKIVFIKKVANQINTPDPELKGLLSKLANHK